MIQIFLKKESIKFWSIFDYNDKNPDTIRIQGKIKRHCIYGADADLIMLGLSTHDPHFYIIWESLEIPDKFS